MPRNVTLDIMLTALTKEATERTLPNEPIEATDRADPLEPMERTEFSDHRLSTEFFEPILRIEFSFCMVFLRSVTMLAPRL
jgi:hypothetical protein